MVEITLNLTSKLISVILYSICSLLFQGVIDKQNGTKNVKNCPSKGDVAILQRLADLESVSKTVPSLAPVVSALKEEVAASVGRQERLVADLEGLHVRVNTLETHNKALANIILPTLVRYYQKITSVAT